MTIAMNTGGGEEKKLQEEEASSNIKNRWRGKQIANVLSNTEERQYDNQEWTQKLNIAHTGI